MDVVTEVHARAALTAVYRVSTASATAPATVSFRRAGLRPTLVPGNEYVAKYEGGRWARVEVGPGAPSQESAGVTSLIDSSAPFAVFPGKTEYRATAPEVGSVFHLEGVTVELSDAVVMHELRLNARRLRAFAETVGAAPSWAKLSGLPAEVELRIRSNGRQLKQATTNAAGEVRVQLQPVSKRFSLEASVLPNTVH